MSKKRKSSFKERLLANRLEAERKREEFIEKRFVMVDIEDRNMIAKVDRGNLFVSSEEVQDVVKDLFYIGANLKENSIIDLDNICDVCYKLNYKGLNGNEALFSLC